LNKTILLFFLFNATLFAQYTRQDSALVATTFTREFNKNIIYNYLGSNNYSKTISALLSISHSEDTTFVDSVISLDFNKYGKYILFTLEELGESKKSVNYLNTLLNKNSVNYRPEIYNAIGKCGDSLTLKFLLKSVENSSIISTGFPLAIASFQMRGITNKNTSRYLAKYLKSNLSAEELFNTLYGLYRLGGIKQSIPELTNIISKNVSEEITLYALRNLQLLKYFPNDFKLFKRLITSKSWTIRTEAANTLCYFPFRNYKEITLYLNLLKDKNPNVSRSAAISMRKIKLPLNINPLQAEIEKLLNSDNLPHNTQGELFISYANLYKIEPETAIDNYEDKIEPKYVYRFLKENIFDWKFNYNYLNDKIKESNEIELLDLLPAYLALQNKLFTEDEYAAHLFNILQTNSPSSVSIIADGLKRPFVQHYRNLMQEIITEQIFVNKNNPQFAEAIISLTNLAYKVDHIFYDSIIEILTTSKLYSIKKFAFNKQGIKFSGKKENELFNKLWANAFKYKFARIKTSKGNFIIELLPKYAPITCGNFSMLATNGFYNNVTFHRVVPDFVIQTGDTTGTGWCGAGHEIVSEFSPRPFDKGAVGIASIGKDTEDSQWFIMHSLYPHLNGRYTNWAKVIFGMEVVNSIDEGDKIINIKLVKHYRK